MTIILSLNVSKHIIRSKVSLGDGENKNLRNSIRAHANLVENAPIFCLLLLINENLNHTTLANLCGIIFFAARVLHAVGITQYKLKLRFRLRQLGSLLTSIVMTILAVSALTAIF
jgi:uncharacterized membrane protein YecN with MAPEG domain